MQPGLTAKDLIDEATKKIGTYPIGRPQTNPFAERTLTTARLARRSRPLEVSNMQFNGDGETRSYVDCEQENV
jgi:hypothetical protein